jgi:hypothetical protein
MLCAAGLAAGPAYAQDGAAYPRLDAEIGIEIQDDYVADSDDSDAELNDLYTTTEPYFSFKATRQLSLEAGFVLEPVQDPDPGDDRVFEDHGLYAEELYVNYAGDGFDVYAGKFNPSFGTAWDIAPGIYGSDLAEDYEITERIGAGGALVFGEGGLGGEGFGTHRLAANTFFADTTFLSESAITDRGELDEADGGVSNTEDFSSFSVTLDGEGFSAAPIGYHLGVQHQEAGVGDSDHQTGFVAGLNGSFALGEDTAVEPLIEVAAFDGFDGGDEDRTYLTAGATVLHGPWNTAVSYTGRFTDAGGGNDTDDGQIQFSAGYAFANGLTADIGYKYVEEGEVDSHVIGVLLTYSLDFSISG